MKVYIIRYYISRIVTVLCAPWILLSSLLSIAYLSSEHVRLFKDIMNIICAYQRRTKIFCDAVSELQQSSRKSFCPLCPTWWTTLFQLIDSFLENYESVAATLKLNKGWWLAITHAAVWLFINVKDMDTHTDHESPKRCSGMVWRSSELAPNRIENWTGLNSTFTRKEDLIQAWDDTVLLKELSTYEIHVMSKLSSNSLNLIEWTLKTLDGTKATDGSVLVNILWVMLSPGEASPGELPSQL